jgi:hypothetical protein
MGAASKMQLTLIGHLDGAHHPQWRSSPSAFRRSRRSCQRKIDNEAGNVLAMWMQPAHRIHATERPARRKTDATVAWHAGLRVRDDSAGTRDGTKLGVRVATPHRRRGL